MVDYLLFILGKVNDQLTSCVTDTNALKGRPCLALRPRRQDLPTHQNHGGHLSSAVMKFKQKSNRSRVRVMVPESSSSFISKELGF